MLDDTKYVEQLIRDYSKGGLTVKEFIEQVSEMRGPRHDEGKMLDFVEKETPERIGRLFKEYVIATVIDCGWEGYSESEQVAVMRHWGDFLIFEEEDRKVYPEVEPDADRSNGGTWPNEG
jgi:hypothetical protein